LNSPCRAAQATIELVALIEQTSREGHELAKHFPHLLLIARTVSARVGNHRRLMQQPTDF